MVPRYQHQAAHTTPHRSPFAPLANVFSPCLRPSLQRFCLPPQLFDTFCLELLCILIRLARHCGPKRHKWLAHEYFNEGERPSEEPSNSASFRVSDMEGNRWYHEVLNQFLYLCLLFAFDPNVG